MFRPMLTKTQATYFLSAAIVLYALAFVSSYFVSSWFSNNPYASDLNMYQLLSGIPNTLPIAAAFLLGYYFTTVSFKILSYIIPLDAALAAITFNIYSRQFSADPYIYMIPTGRTYVLTDFRLTLFTVFASVLIGGSLSFLHRRNKRKENTTEN